MKQVPEENEGEQLTLFEIATAILEARRRVVAFVAIGAVIAILFAVTRPALYMASTSFVPQGNDPSRSSLASLAGQFGVSVPASSQSTSLDFYARLLKSREILLPVVRDTFEVDGDRVSFVELNEIKDGSEARREEQALEILSTIVDVSTSKLSGVVEITAATRWPPVSLAIANRLLDEVNKYNQRTRQGQAGAERKFIEGRLDLAKSDLREAENQLERFLANNRMGNSPELSFARERLERELALAQQVHASLVLMYQEARIREVRDTPVITVLESPSVPTTPKPRGRIKIVILGIILGLLAGVFVAVMPLVGGWVRSSNAKGFEVFSTAVRQVRDELPQFELWRRPRT